jgi:hypothetical protein
MVADRMILAILFQCVLYMSLIMLNNPCAYLEHEMILILFNANLSYLERKGHLGVRLATGEVLFIVFIFGESEHV